MKNVLKIIFTTLFILILSTGSYTAAQTAPALGQEEFVDFLVKNKELLGYESFGTFEHADRMEVRIYCTDDSRSKIEANLSFFNNTGSDYVATDPGKGTLFVVFAKGEKPAEAVAAEPAAEPPTEVKVKCPKKVYVESEKIVLKEFNEHQYFEQGLTDGGSYSLTAPSGGTVTSVFVSPGEVVEEGAALLSIDDPELDKKIAETTEELSGWQTNLKKRRQWKERSERAEKQAEDMVNSLEEKLAGLKALKEKNNVVSGKKGQVISVVAAGTEVAEGDEIARILDNSVMKMVITGDDAALFSSLEVLSVRFDGVERIMTGKVEMEEGKAVVRFDNSDLKLSADSVGKFKLLIKTHAPSVVINNAFIKKDETGSFVYIIQKKRAKKIYVQTGPSDNGDVMILSGLNEGDELIITDDECLKDGKKIIFTAPVVKEKPGKVKPEKIKKEVDVTGRLLPSKFAAGAGLGLYTVSDDVFTNVYGSAVISGMLDFSYNVFNHFELFTNIWYIPKSGSSASIDKVNLSMFSFYIGGKYLIKWYGKFLPYVGAALNSLAVKEKSDELGLDTSYRTSVGFSGIGGFYYRIKDNINVRFDIRYDRNVMKIEEFESELDFSGLKFAVGVMFRF